MITVDTDSFIAIVVIAALAAVIVAAVPKRFAPPVVVLELVLGILIGPEVLGLAHTDAFVDFFSNLGLGMLFFFAGYEIDFERIRGRPMRLGALGWLLSVAAARAWSLGQPPTKRVWVHTCSLDGPHALANYRARGFQVFRTETHRQAVSGEPPGPWPRAARSGSVLNI